MNMNSLAGIIGVVFFIVVGQINRKVGARITSGVCCIISGITYIIACSAPNIAVYTIAMCFVYGSIMSARLCGWRHPGCYLVSQEERRGHGLHHHGPQLRFRFYVQLVAILICPHRCCYQRGRRLTCPTWAPTSPAALFPSALPPSCWAFWVCSSSATPPRSAASTPTTSPTRSTRTSMTPPTPWRATAVGPPASCWPPRSCGWPLSPPVSSRSALWAL